MTHLVLDIDSSPFCFQILNFIVNFPMLFFELIKLVLKIDQGFQVLGAHIDFSA